MNGEGAQVEGFTARVRRIGESLLALGHGRAELFCVELQEEKLRLLKLLLGLGIALGLGFAGLLVGIGTLSVWLWEVAGYAGLLGLTAAALGAAAVFLLGLRHSILHGPAPFNGTIGEIKKDLECFGQAN